MKELAGERREGARGRPPAARILFVEDTIRGLGGSYESLFVTASGLDRSRFEPIVLFYQPNHFAERLEALGVRVLFERSRAFWEKEGYIQGTSKARKGLPRRGLLGQARRRLVAFLRTLVAGLPTAWRLWRILRRERIDLLHTNNNLQRDAMSILAGVAAGCPVVAHERQLAPCTGLAALLSARVATLICISEAVLEHTRSSGTRTRDRRLVYNAIDVEAVRRIVPSLEPGPPRVGIVGRILPKKGQLQFVEAAQKIRERHPDVRFYIIGQATAEHRGYEEAVRGRAAALEVAESIEWTGYLEEPLPLVASLDVLVHAAIEPEPFGRVIIEGLALGRAVVATALGGPVEIIEDRVSGLLVPPDDPGAIANAVNELLDDGPLCARIREGAARRAEEFSVRRYLDAIEAVYDQALGRTRGRDATGGPAGTTAVSSTGDEVESPS